MGTHIRPFTRLTLKVDGEEHIWTFDGYRLIDGPNPPYIWAAGHATLTLTCLDTGRVRREYRGQWSRHATLLYRQIGFPEAQLEQQPWRYADGDTAAYLRWVRCCREAFETQDRVVTRRAGHALTKAEWTAEFRRALDRRINLKVGPEPLWRNLDPDYQMRLYRDRGWLEEIGRGRRVYQFDTELMRQRFGHLLASRSDDY